MAKPLATTIATLPTRDQLALRLLSHAVQAGHGMDDPEATVARAYRLADCYLDRARQSWREAQAAAKGETAEADEADDAQDQSAAA